MKYTIKIILISIIILGFVKQIKAQNLPVAGSHFSNTTMTAFQGTWRWTSGTDTVKLQLLTAIVSYNINGGYTADRLVGWYYYKKGNNVIFSNYSSIPNTFAYSRIAGSNSAESLNKVEAFFKDPLKEKTIRLSLILNQSQNQIIWSAYGIGLGYTTQTSMPSSGITLPSNMTFIRL